MDSGTSIRSESSNEDRSGAKVLTGQKRNSSEIEETSEDSDRIVKLRTVASISKSEGRKLSNQAAHYDINASSRSLDLNAKAGFVDEEHCFEKEEGQYKEGLSKCRSFDFDLNADDLSSSVNDSENSCFNAPPRESESMKLWEGLKQSNYMSLSMPVPIPKPCGRKKSRNDATKKSQQVSRIARPSGLLNGLNLGIINHVRNSKQVRNIIANVVMSEDNAVAGMKRSHHGGRIIEKENKESDHVDHPCLRTRQISDSRAKSLGGDGSTKDEDDRLGLRLASQNENPVTLNDESADVKAVTSLSIKAANVATQWLELLIQDTRGRLAALKRSKKRIRAIIYTELPLLLSREFSCPSQKDARDDDDDNTGGCHHPDKALADAHFLKWSNLFKQTDEALDEEELSLEKMLSQLKQVESHCRNGIIGNTRLEETSSSGLGNDMAVRAAAASIYSTCNYLLSKENLHR